jgi:hypothetical protein
MVPFAAQQVGAYGRWNHHGALREVRQADQPEPDAATGSSASMASKQPGSGVARWRNPTAANHSGAC